MMICLAFATEARRKIPSPGPRDRFGKYLFDNTTAGAAGARKTNAMGFRATPDGTGGNALALLKVDVALPQFND
jgi:hypothetical protein